MGKTRDLFKKTGDAKGTFCAKKGSIRGKNIWRNYTKKTLMTQITRWCDHSPRAGHPGI